MQQRVSALNQLGIGNSWERLKGRGKRGWGREGVCVFVYVWGISVFHRGMPFLVMVGFGRAPELVLVSWDGSCL